MNERELFKKCSVELGDEVKDPITGFVGTAVAVTFWINNCARVCVQPKGLDKEGKVKSSETFDHMQLVVTKAINPKPEPRKNGGPCDDRASQKR
jgi:hypothetical protein